MTNPTSPPPAAHDVPALIDRFVSPEPNSGCWLWIGRVSPQGYGRTYLPGTRKTTSAHRRVYEFYCGRVPDGLVLDHLCRVKSCVNPAHLEPVTNRENILRGVGPTAQNAAKDTCANGHPLSGDNLRTSKLGVRQCRICSYALAKARWDARREKRFNQPRNKSELIGPAERRAIADAYKTMGAKAVGKQFGVDAMAVLYIVREFGEPVRPRGVRLTKNHGAE